MEYNLLYVKNLSFAAGKRPGGTLTQTILYLEPNDYQINFVNIDSCHQYGIWGAHFAGVFPVNWSLVARN